MLPNEKLTMQFNKFAGREVSVTETVHNTKYGDMTSVDINDGDIAVNELRLAAQAAGMSLRVWLPGKAGTADFLLDRLNANVKKESDGKYRIQKDFRIG